MPKRQYRVRIREKLGSYKWMLKTRFYNVNTPGEAARKYKGNGEVIRVEKVPRGFGGFFTQGEKLLQEFAEEARKEKVGRVGELQPINSKESPPGSDKGKKYYNRQRRGAY